MRASHIIFSSHAQLYTQSYTLCFSLLHTQHTHRYLMLLLGRRDGKGVGLIHDLGLHRDDFGFDHSGDFLLESSLLLLVNVCKV